MPAVESVRRGCGDAREAGGLYLEVGTSPFGMALEHFLSDPVQQLTADQLASIPRIGVTLVEGERGIVHVIDWVGESGYAYAADFLEEGRRKGFSRKISKLVEIDRLTPGQSRVYFVHPKGYLNQHWLYDNHWHDPHLEKHCKVRTKHAEVARTRDEMCVRTLWCPPPADFRVPGESDGPPLRTFVDMTYRVFPPRREVRYDGYPAFIASLPITNFAVVRAPNDSHKETLRKARNTTKFDVYEAEG